MAKYKITSQEFWLNKINGFAVSPLEVALFLVLVLSAVNLTFANIQESNLREFDRKAALAYDQIKTAAYSEMSSPTPRKKYLIKNLFGPISLPAPLQDLIIDKGVRLNYLVRVYQPGRNVQPKDQLRFEVTHDQGRLVYRYTEVHGQILEQVIEKTVIDD